MSLSSAAAFLPALWVRVATLYRSTLLLCTYIQELHTTCVEHSFGATMSHRCIQFVLQTLRLNAHQQLGFEYARRDLHSLSCEW